MQHALLVTHFLLSEAGCVQKLQKRKKIVLSVCFKPSVYSRKATSDCQRICFISYNLISGRLKNLRPLIKN